MLLVLRFVRSSACLLAILFLSSSMLWAQVESVALPKNTGEAEKKTENHSLYITLEEAQKLALEGNATLRSQQLSLEASRREAQSRWNSFLPGISLSGSLSNSHTIYTPKSSGPGSGGAGGNSSGNSAWSWGASGGLNLSLTAGIPVQMKLASLRYELAQINYESQRQTILSSVASSFYNLLTSTKNLTVLEDNVALTRQQYQQALQNYNRGLASELDMLRAQYAALSAEPQLDKARSQYESDLAAFQLLIGSQEKYIPQGDFSLQQLQLPEAQVLVDSYLEQRLDVIQKRQSVQEAELSKTAQVLSAKAPSISLSENIRLSPTGNSTSGTPSVSGSFSVGVSIPVDGYIPGSSKSLTVEKSKDSVETARINLETTLAQARQDIINKANNVKLLWHSVEVARLNETIAERSYQLSQEGYRAGLVSQTDMENSRQQMVSAQLSGSTSQSQYLVGVEQLAIALGLQVQEVYELFGI